MQLPEVKISAAHGESEVGKDSSTSQLAALHMTPISDEGRHEATAEQQADICETDDGDSDDDDQWMPGRVRDIFLGALCNLILQHSFFYLDFP